MAHQQPAADIPTLLTLPPSGSQKPDDGNAPHRAHWLLQLVHDGRADGLFPYRCTAGPDDTLATGAPLSGPADAARLAELLATPAFAPLLRAADRIDTWCRTTADTVSAATIAPNLLRRENTALFGPVLLEIFQACAATDPDTATRFADERTAQYEAALGLFLTRLHRDLGSAAWPTGDAWQGPVTAVQAGGDETHNGGQRVLRLTLQGGASLAYKPRPADGEILLMADDTSLFALLNSLSGPSGGAAGPVRLPTLRAWGGPDEDAGYSWQEWVNTTAEQGTLRAEGPWQLTGTVLPPQHAAHFWHRTGNLTAAVYALGLSDLTGDNVLTGARPGDEPLTYPVDLESCLGLLPRLSSSSLLPVPSGAAADPSSQGRQHHVGVECEARWCDLSGPVLYWHEAADGTLELRRRVHSMLRTQTRAVVADTGGRVGYAPYLAAMLRGMFDAWTLLVRHRERVIEFLTERAPHTRVRYIARSTMTYSSAVGATLWPLEGSTAAELPEFSADERQQLDQWDAPYFFRTADGGPLQAMGTPPGPFRSHPAAVDSPFADTQPPHPDVLSGARLTLADLGAALYDAVLSVDHQLDTDEVHDPELGVRLTRHRTGVGEVAFDWTAVGRRITYHWTQERLRLEISALVPGPTDADTGRTSSNTGKAGTQEATTA